MLFLRRHPTAFCLQLTEDDQEDVRALADNVDRCAASIHQHLQLLPGSANTTDNCEDNNEPPDYSVMAVGSNRGGCFPQWSCGGQNRPKSGRGSQRPQFNGGSRSPASPSWPSRLVCAATTSYTATRPTTVAATAAGWETKLPRQCQHRLPRPPVLPQGPHHRRTLPGLALHLQLQEDASSLPPLPPVLRGHSPLA